MKFLDWIVPQSPRSLMAGLTNTLTAYLCVGAATLIVATTGAIALVGLATLPEMFVGPDRPAASERVVRAIATGLAGYLVWHWILRPLGRRTVAIGAAAFVAFLCASAVAAYYFAAPFNVGRIGPTINYSEVH